MQKAERLKQENADVKNVKHVKMKHVNVQMHENVNVQKRKNAKAKMEKQETQNTKIETLKQKKEENTWRNEYGLQIMCKSNL